MKTGIREKLRLAAIRLTDLSTYLGISRPTLYNMLNVYESSGEQLEKRYFDFLKYLDELRFISTPLIIEYLNSHNMLMTSDTIILNFKERLTQQDETSLSSVKIELIEAVKHLKDNSKLLVLLHDYLTKHSRPTINGLIKHLHNEGGNENE